MPNGDLHVHFRSADVADTVRVAYVLVERLYSWLLTRCVAYVPKFTSWAAAAWVSLGLLATSDKCPSLRPFFSFFHLSLPHAGVK